MTSILLVGSFAILLSKVEAQVTPVAGKRNGYRINTSGTMGVSYEHYGLITNPDGWSGFTPRKPWNQVRFNFSPRMQFGENFSLPFNINFATTPTSSLGPYSGIRKQSFGQFITNPMNSFGLNPKYKWAELQLGTQYLNYSDLSTGDIGVFGGGFDLRPGTFLFKFFTGLSQQGINFFTGPPQTNGAYQRNHWMASVGKAKEGKYELALNFVKGRDDINSVDSVPANIKPQEGFTMSIVGKGYFNDGWYFSAEGARSIYTKDLLLPKDSSRVSFKPFIEGRTSTVRDYAADASIGKKSRNFDIGAKLKFIGAGFQTPGYPFMMPDRLDYTLNTRFNAWKDSTGNYKMNVVASVGQRVNNVSKTTQRAKQFIGNINWFTQFDEHWNLNVSFNNFGFQAPGGLNPFGIKNVSNDFGISPSYTWNNEKMVHLFTLTYNYSNYDERDVITGNITSNNTHMALLSYIPTFLLKEIAPDFSIMYFLNKLPAFRMTLITLSSGLSWSALKKKMNLRGQLQYTYSKTNAFKNNNNLIVSASSDWRISERVTWNVFLSSNYFRYGNEIIPNNANYLESNVRTGLQYRFGN
ncbi:MAG TPA: hypothetical protein VEB63_08170 [Chitinophagaceae bacterium]|nr:hypothetical protein [Chitinophagaceae bacterium]